MKKRFIWMSAGMIIAIALAIAASRLDQKLVVWWFERLPFINRFFRPTVAGQIAKYGIPARARLQSKFENRHIQYPPDRLAFVALKDTKQLQVYAAPKQAPFQYVCDYPILAASGQPGPKLRSGDRQVPEGIYRLSLEPNTPYHLALRLNYPNQSDLARARADGRDNPGSDILIHGSDGSIGCIAMGDQVSEDLFVLANDTKDKSISLIVSPVDLRTNPVPAAQPGDPKWLPELYQEIKSGLAQFPNATE